MPRFHQLRCAALSHEVHLTLFHLSDQHFSYYLYLLYYIYLQIFTLTWNFSFGDKIDFTFTIIINFTRTVPNAFPIAFLFYSCPKEVRILHFCVICLIFTVTVQHYQSISKQHFSYRLSFHYFTKQPHYHVF